MRRSRWEHLKPEIWQAFAKGKQPKQIIDEFGLPTATAYVWFKEFQKDSRIPERILESSIVTTATIEQYENIDISAKTGSVVPLDRKENMSDFAFARSLIRDRESDEPNAFINVQRAKVLLEFVFARIKHTKEELEKDIAIAPQALQQALDKAATPADLQQEIKKLLADG